MLFSEWLNEQTDDHKMESLVRRGLSMSTDRSYTVWDELMSLMSGNRNEFAELLGVRPDVISRASGKIGKILQKVREEDESEDKRRVKRTMIHTGI